MHRIRIGILRGGSNNHFDHSIKTGGMVLENLELDRYSPKEILIDKNFNWFLDGTQSLPSIILDKFDIIFNALHGSYGEDGKIQHILESHGIPFTGPGSFSSVLSTNKLLLKDIYKINNIKNPQFKIIESKKDINKQIYSLFRSFPLPLVVKPTSQTSTAGTVFVKDFFSLESSITNAFKDSDSVIIEEFINGKRSECIVIDSYRNKEFYTLPAVEIRSDKSEVIPGNFLESEKRQIEQVAINAHVKLGLRHYSSSSFIVHPKRGVFIIETKSLPKLDNKEILPKALKSVGASMSHFLDHIVQLALSRK